MGLPRAIVMVRQKSSGLEALLFFFWSGLGQIYTGQVLKGIAMMVAFPLCNFIGCTTVVSGDFLAIGANPTDAAAAGGMAIFGLIALICAGGIWIYGMINAYRTAERLNQMQVAGMR
jgi:hypothetical protein